MTRLRLVLACALACNLVACNSEPPAGPRDSGGGTDSGAPPGGDSGPPGDSGPGVDSGPRPDSGGACPDIDVSGDVDGEWCGTVHVLANTHVAAGATLTILAGTQVLVAGGARITIDGTVTSTGTDAAHVTFAAASGNWAGFLLNGTLTAAFNDITGATQAMHPNAGSTLVFDDGTISMSTNTLTGAGDMTLDRTTLSGGSTIAITGGILRMTDSVIDLGRPVLGPDCTDWAGGTTALDHVRFTGCHCPLHFNSTSGAPIMITSSIFDGATNPVMIASSMGEFHDNVFDGTGSLMLDIGRGIDVDVANNYWGGGAADINSPQLSQFRNATMFLATAPADAGPR